MGQEVDEAAGEAATKHAVVEACQERLRRPWDLSTSSQEGDERRDQKDKKARRITEVRPFKFCGGHTSRRSKNQL